MKKAKDIQEQSAERVQRIRNDWKEVLHKMSYKALINNVPYMAFVALLCVLYISNNKRAVETQRLLNKENEVLKELRWEYMDIKSQVMYAQMETQVIKSAASIGLMPMTSPAFTIKTDTTSVAKK